MRNQWIVFVLALLVSSYVQADPSKFWVGGYVFEDYNYGGESRDFYPGASGMSTMSLNDIDVVLTNIYYPYQSYSGKTKHDGQFWIKKVPNGTYRLTLPNARPIGNDLDGQLYSERGDCYDCLPVQVWPYVSENYQRTVEVRGQTVYDANIGFSYSVVSNHHDRGVGTLRQFLINTRYLIKGRKHSYLTKEKLRQSGHPYGVDNAIFVNQINDIVLQSKLQIIDTEDTYVDATVRLGGERPLTMRNGRTNPLEGDYGLEIIGSEDIRISGTNWDYFDDAIYINGSDEIELIENSFNHTKDSGVKIVDGEDNIIARNIFNDTVNNETSPHEEAALFIYSGSGNTIEGNAFYYTGTGGEVVGKPFPVASAVRVYYGAEQRISQNTFLDTSGLAIDLRMYHMIGHHSPNDGQYNWGGAVSNHGIDYPILQNVSTDGSATGRVSLFNIDHFTKNCNGSYEDFRIELYKADGQASNNTLEGTAFLGTCSLDNKGNINSCNLDTSRFNDGDSITSIAIDKCGNTSEMGQTVIAGGDGPYDYGDAPNEDLLTGWDDARYEVSKHDDGARHIVTPGVCLLPMAASYCAPHITEEIDAVPSRYATSDAGDDGVVINPNHSELPPFDDESNSPSMRVLVTGYFDQNGVEQPVANQISVRASQAGYVSIWLDKNQDGSWQGFQRNQQFVSEKIVDRLAIHKGDNLIGDINLSAYDVHGESFLRVRYSTDKNAISTPTGMAPDGEVEDYQVWIAAPSLEVAGCEAGLQNGSFERFYQEHDHNGWDTPESSVAGWSIQQLDPKAYPQDYRPPQPRRNHIEFNRYDYYVAAPSSDGSTNVAEMNVYNPTMMYQDIVTKPGDKIRWSFDYSNRTYPNRRDNDQISLLFGSPNSELTENQTIDGQDRWVNHTGVYTVPQGQYVTRIAFRGNLPDSSSSGNIIDNAKFGCELGLDYGDLPRDYRDELSLGYRVVPNLYIGEEAPDVERFAHSSEYAIGDNQAGFNDELTFESPIIIKRQNAVEIKDIKVFNNTGRNAHLRAWIDFDSDKKMSPNEMKDVVVLSRSHMQTISVAWSGNHKWADNTQSTYLRLALGFTDKQVTYGEIEDHLVYITDGDLMPQPGRCDGFVQVKAPEAGNYQYARWVTNKGELDIENINPSLATDEIKVVGLSQADGLTYGVGADNNYACTSGRSMSCQHLFVADQQQGAEFNYLAPIRAAHNGIVIRDRYGNNYTFNKNEVLNTQKRPDHCSRALSPGGDCSRSLSRANSGDVSIDGRYMVIGRGTWHTLVRIDLATGLFDTIQLNNIQGSTPWSADFAFNPKDPTGSYVYALKQDLTQLYRIAIKDVSSSEPAGSFRTIDLQLKLNSSADGKKPVWPVRDADKKLGAGGVAINKGGIMFAMTNGGRHDLDQDGDLSNYERNHPTTALYSIDLEKEEIRFELKGVDKSTTSNDAGGCSIHADYGDVPESLEGGNPARHLGGSEFLKLGNTWSADIGPGHDPEAASDLSDDGVFIRDRATNTIINIAEEPLIPGRSYSIHLDKRGGGYASVWVNWGNDSEWYKVNDLSSGISVPSIPTNHGNRGYLRVRYSSAQVQSPYGEAHDGEVEDHSFEIGNPVKGIEVKAPGSPLTCEVAQYKILLDVDGGQLSEDVNVDVSFDVPPTGCWFNATAFERGNANSQTRCSTGKTILFSKGSNLERTIWVATDSELQNVTLTANAVDVGSDSDSALFSKEGFKIVLYQAPNYYKAGEEFQIQLVRNVALEDQTQCSVDPDYQGDKTFTFRYNKGLEKVLGNLALKGKALNASGEDRTVSFSNGVSEILPASYSESGKLNIEADYLPTEGKLKTSEFSETFTPYALAVRQNYKADDESVVSQFGSAPFVSAGTPFMVEVDAVNKAGIITQNFDGQLSSGSTGYSASIVVPASQSTVTPLLSSPSGLNRQFVSGVLLNKFEYDNVGSIKTRWVVDSYRGESQLKSFLDTSKVTDLANHDVVGYFYPDHYSMTRRYQVPMKHDNGEPWTYFGKPDVDVAFTLQAKSANNRDLSFYDASKLASNELPALADLSFDYGDSTLPACNQSLLVDEQMKSIEFDDTWSNGQWQLPAQPYQFYRDSECKQELADIQLQASVEDNIVGVSVPVYEQGDVTENFAGTAITLGEPIDVRFGRLVIKNASGPINQLFPMAIQTEYWHNNKFAINAWDDATQIGLGNEAELPEVSDIVTEPSVTGQSSPVLIADSMKVDEPKLEAGKTSTVIGADAPGSVLVPMQFSQGVEKWLGYCWEIDNDPSTSAPSKCGSQSSFWQPPKAIATFGVSGGSNNVIYFMERYQ
ncbi:right-handed parallel beta-helix repeat-containing protein [Vibrio sp. 404]|uniref:Probable pectate lyase C n=1 Tax=Vibrio marinisediminis TaxID=2758441 RepID=A0A7W2IT40_9VIBR|nr:DUF6701 domain-containing protein [Vibrio marinisediminis]MBA5761768.1 right-handed parallel beta-helix repeat-containing protein [Vibrio marinisediminis]